MSLAKYDWNAAAIRDRVVGLRAYISRISSNAFAASIYGCSTDAYEASLVANRATVRRCKLALLELRLSH